MPEHPKYEIEYTMKILGLPSDPTLEYIDRTSTFPQIKWLTEGHPIW